MIRPLVRFLLGPPQPSAEVLALTERLEHYAHRESIRTLEHDRLQRELAAARRGVEAGLQHRSEAEAKLAEARESRDAAQLHAQLAIEQDVHRARLLRSGTERINGLLATLKQISEGDLGDGGAAGLREQLEQLRRERPAATRPDDPPPPPPGRKVG